MKKFVIKIDDIIIEAECLEDAKNGAIDVVNDIGGDGGYTVKELKDK
jgi:hypothetical protein